MKIEVLFQHPQALPVMPQVVQQLVSSLASESLHNDHLVRLISSDSVISAELLRCANSAYFERANTIATVDQALQQLGFVNVRSLVIRIGLMTRFVSVPAVLLKPFWQHSLYTAVAARYWAPGAGVNADLAYILGLLHAVGQLVMRISLSEPLQEIDRQMSPQHRGRPALEQQVFGFSYRQVGAELARRWQFPEVFGQVIEGSSAAPDPVVASLSALVDVAAWQAWRSIEQLDEAVLTATWPEQAARRIGLLPEQAGENFPPWQSLWGKLELSFE